MTRAHAAAHGLGRAAPAPYQRFGRGRGADGLRPAGIPTSEYKDRGSTPRVLTPAEIDKMRTVCRIGREVLDRGAAAIRPGVTADEIDRVVHEATIARNAYPSPLNYNGFPKSCCTSVNEVICHGIPDLRPLQEGDLVNLDVSVFYNGYHSDLNETFFVGKVSDRVQKLVQVSRECIEKAIALGTGSPARPGRLRRRRGGAGTLRRGWGGWLASLTWKRPPWSGESHFSNRSRPPVSSQAWDAVPRTRQRHSRARASGWLFGGANVHGARHPHVRARPEPHAGIAGQNS